MQAAIKLKFKEPRKHGKQRRKWNGKCQLSVIFIINDIYRFVDKQKKKVEIMQNKNAMRKVYINFTSKKLQPEKTLMMNR